MIAELKWEGQQWSSTDTEWLLMAGKLKIARVVPGSSTGRWCVLHWERGGQWFKSLKDAKRAAEKLAGVASGDRCGESGEQEGGAVMDVTLKGFWIDTNYRGRPAKTLLVCGVEVGAVWIRPDGLFCAQAWPRYGGAVLDHPKDLDVFATEAVAMAWVKETVENAPLPLGYLKLVGAAGPPAT